jgi:uncharacterized membrane protein
VRLALLSNPVTPPSGGQNGRVSPSSEDPGAEAPEEGGRAHDPTPEHLHARLQRVERLLDPELKVLQRAGEDVLVPAWRRVTKGEPRLPVSVTVGIAIALQLSLPNSVAPHPRWLLPGLAGLLLVGIYAANPRRIDRPSPRLRAASLVLIAVISFANGWSAIRLIDRLINGTATKNPRSLLATGAAIWLTNVVVFALWYWEFDRGGPVARAQATSQYPDFLYPQMENPHLAPPLWEPAFVDYLYVSFTNATAFSPTDVLPLSRWAKLAMMMQSAVSVSTVALVIARAVNILQ